MRSLLERANSKLDGTYIEFESCMVDDGSQAQETLKELCACMAMGVWGVKPDTSLSAKVVADLGVRYVNTDLPSSFVQPAACDV